MINLEAPGEKITDKQTVGRFRDAVFLLFKQSVPNIEETLNKNKFPGGHPVSCSRNLLNPQIKYLLCQKSDGVRYLLYIPQIKQQTGIIQAYVFLIDRKYNFWKIVIQAPAIMLVGNSLFDCQLVLDYGTQVRILVFDTLFCAGQCFLYNSYTERLRAAWQYFIYPVRRNGSSRNRGIQVYLKDFFSVSYIDFIWQQQNKLPHKCDGLIFTRDDAPYVIGTNQNILKWKPAQLNSIDFVVRFYSGQFRLYTLGDREEEFGVLVQTSREEEEILRNNPGIIAECVYVQGWKLYKLRTDKNQPNNTIVAHRIFQTIRERLTIEQLIQILDLVNEDPYKKTKYKWLKQEQMVKKFYSYIKK